MTEEQEAIGISEEYLQLVRDNLQVKDPKLEEALTYLYKGFCHILEASRCLQKVAEIYNNPQLDYASLASVDPHVTEVLEGLTATRSILREVQHMVLKEGVGVMILDKAKKGATHV